MRTNLRSQALDPDVKWERRLARFWANVEVGGPDECWPWTSWGDRNGRGYTTIRGVRTRCSWVVLELAGHPRPEGAFALHSCDNPPCLNPAHLRWGTQSENLQEMYDKGRRPKGADHAWSQLTGESHPQSKLTWSKVREIRQRGGGETKTALADEFGVSRKTILNILNHRTWKEVIE